MARITDLASLRDAIRAELNRVNETDATIDGFIERAESSIKRLGDNIVMQGGINAYLAQGTRFGVFSFPTPSPGVPFFAIVDVQDVYTFGTQEISGDGNPIEEIADQRRRQLFPLGTAQLETLTGAQRNIAGPPTHYVSFSPFNITVDRPADQNYVLVVSAMFFQGLNFDDPTYSSGLLQFAPDLYLYGSLKASAPYFKDDQRLPLWEKLFEQARSELDLQYERQKWPSTPIAPVPKVIGDFSTLEQA